MQEAVSSAPLQPGIFSTVMAAAFDEIRPHTLRGPLAWLLILITAAVAALGVIEVANSVIPGQALGIRDGWEAASVGDLRLAGDLFLHSVEAEIDTTAALRGASCVAWVSGYQDVAVWYQQSYLALTADIQERENECLSLESWGIRTTWVDGSAQLYVDPDNPVLIEGVLPIALGEAQPVDLRFLALACLNHGAGFRLLAATQLDLGIYQLESDAARAALEGDGSEVAACLAGTGSAYEWSDGTLVPSDFADRLFFANLSPIPRSSLLLPMPQPIGPDGAPLTQEERS